MKRLVLLIVCIIIGIIGGVFAFLQIQPKQSPDKNASYEVSPIIVMSTASKNNEENNIIGKILRRSERNASNNEEINKEIEQKIQSIINSSSEPIKNPHKLIGKNSDFEYIVKQKDVALNYMLKKFENSSENGAQEFVMAIACAQIFGENIDERKWETGRGWYDLYSAREYVVESGCLEDIYIKALDVLMPIDPGLNSDMKYIAIDESKLKYLSKNEMDEVLEYFNKKYKVEVFDASYEKLKEMGKVKGMSLEGILLDTTKVEIIDKNNVIIYGCKYKGGLASIGTKSKITFVDGKWKLESSGMTWIS